MAAVGDTRTVPRPAQVHNLDHTNAVSLVVASALVVAALPGALVGALLAAAVWRLTRPDIVSRWLFAGLGAATVAALRSTVAPVFLARDALATFVVFFAFGRATTLELFLAFVALALFFAATFFVAFFALTTFLAFTALVAFVVFFTGTLIPPFGTVARKSVAIFSASPLVRSLEVAMVLVSGRCAL